MGGKKTFNVFQIFLNVVWASGDASRLNLKQLVYDLVTILDRLMIEDFNYFPSVINAVQASLLHLFTLDSRNNSHTVIDILKQGKES